MLVIIDYGMGNLHSVYKAFRRIGADVLVTGQVKDIEKADKLVLPGVGHFKKGMENLIQKGLDLIIKEKAAKQTPMIGICLGMQLLTNYSEEGNVGGLSLIDATTIHFKNWGIENKYKIPHIGWNTIDCAGSSSVLKGLHNEVMYFVHSYAVRCNNLTEVICSTNYGVDFHSGFQKDNIIGVQFHPEKSHKAGLELLKNFMNT
jgi:imidazole glycerol-phosphate synthase subunit HisH